MRHVLVLALIIAAGVIATPVALATTRNPPSPEALRGHWVMMPHACNAADNTLHLRVDATYFDHGETVSNVQRHRSAGTNSYAIDLENVHQEERWRSTVRYTLSARGQRMTAMITHEHHRPVARREAITYRRCR